MIIIQISLIIICGIISFDGVKNEYLTNGDVEYHQQSIDQANIRKQNAENLDKKVGEWKIIFYTGEAVWAGTDSDIYIELIGDLGNSKVIVLRPLKSQMEAKSVDSFYLGDLDGRQIGNLKQIAVGKQYSYAFFNDWQLLKIEVFDPHGKKYLFNCNCWFTSNKYKRMLSLTSIENTNSLNESYNIAARSTRVFPMTLALLFLFFIVVSFTYFGKIMCNKWRDSLIYFSTLGSNESNRNNRRTLRHENEDEITNRLMNISHRNRYANNNQNMNLENLNLSLSQNQTNIMEDKPPDYMELFPYPTNSCANSKEEEVILPTHSLSNNTNTNNTQAQTNNSVTTSQQTNDSSSNSSTNDRETQQQNQQSNVINNQTSV
jgi:hypothetical protein